MEESENNLDIAATPVSAPKVDPKVLIGVVVLVFLAIYVVITFSSRLTQTNSVPEVAVTISAPAEPDPLKPERVESVGVVPEGFSEEFILEENVKLSDSYTLNYNAADNRQLTITIVSKRSMAENYAAYNKYLTEKFWILLNKVESASVSSIYAMKKNEDINVTIEPGSTEQESKVTISLLKK